MVVSLYNELVGIVNYRILQNVNFIFISPIRISMHYLALATAQKTTVYKFDSRFMNPIETSI